MVTEPMIEDIEILDILVGCPDQVIPQAKHDRLQGNAKQLMAKSFLPRQEESIPHERATAEWLESIGEDAVSWLGMYRTSQIDRRQP